MFEKVVCLQKKKKRKGTGIQVCVHDSILPLCHVWLCGKCILQNTLHHSFVKGFKPILQEVSFLQ